MRSLSATRLETYRLVKLPSAAPYIFAGLDMGVVYALLGTIVAEFLGAQQGMGVVITQAQAVTDVAGVFAVLIILGATGIALHVGSCGPSSAGWSTGPIAASTDREQHRDEREQPCCNRRSSGLQAGAAHSPRRSRIGCASREPQDLRPCASASG